MAFHITTPEFSQTIQQALDTLHPNCDPEKPNLHLCPRLVSCDGPSLSVELEYDTKAWTSNPMGIVPGLWPSTRRFGFASPPSWLAAPPPSSRPKSIFPDKRSGFWSLPLACTAPGLAHNVPCWLLTSLHCGGNVF